MNYCSAMKKNKILSFVTTQKDLEGITLSKISQRDKYIIHHKYDVICMWRPKTKTNELK